MLSEAIKTLSIKEIITILRIYCYYDNELFSTDFAFVKALLNELKERLFK